MLPAGRKNHFSERQSRPERQAAAAVDAAVFELKRAPGEPRPEAEAEHANDVALRRREGHAIRIGRREWITAGRYARPPFLPAKDAHRHVRGETRAWNRGERSR